MEDLKMVDGSALLPSVTGNLTEVRQRGVYSKEQWDAQKSNIWRLYNVENKPYKRVLEILRAEYNFHPTYVRSTNLGQHLSQCILMLFRRRQFYRKIDEWGFKKNIKDNEMREIVQNLSSGVPNPTEAPVELRLQRVDPAKIQRWQKKSKLGVKTSRTFSNGTTAGKCMISAAGVKV